MTTWIHGALLGGVKFNRRWKPGSGRGRTAQAALTLGRKVDGHLKAYAINKKIPPKRTLAGSMCTAAIAALRDRHVTLFNANVFLSHGPLKTHVDGVGKRGALTVIVELKTTSRTIDAFKNHYHFRCRSQPTVGSFDNTEYLHHMLQLGWTTMAWRETKQRDLVVGMVVVAASDGAEVFPLDERYAAPQFWKRVLVATPPPSAGPVHAEIPTLIPLWPGPIAAETVAKAVGSTPGRTVSSKVHVLANGAAAVSSLKPPDRVTRKLKTAMVKAVQAVGASTAYYVYPDPTGWRVKPLVLATK
ncbi:MAG: hypothetical protein ACPGR8_01235 [Limisphaerales bacterium]